MLIGLLLVLSLPSSPSVLLDGDKEFERINYPRAISIYDSALTTTTDSASVLWRLARVHVCMADISPRDKKLDLYRLADSLAQRCINIDSMKSEGHTWRAAALGNIAMFEGGKEKVKLTHVIRHELDQAIALDPGNDIAYSILGTFYLALGNVSWVERQLAAIFLGSLPDGGYEEAEQALTKAIAIAPNVVRHHFELGRVYMQMDRNQEAIEEFHPQLQRRSDSEATNVPRNPPEGLRQKLRRNEMIDLQKFLAFARALALAAENPIMHLYQNCAVSMKSDGSEVTEADRGAEQIMREMIARVYPAHDILGEEFGGVLKSDREFQWVLDPIDGTSSFVLGLPTFGTLVGLLMNGEPVLGVMNFPAMGETLYAAKGLGCWFESRNTTPERIQVCTPVLTREATVSVSGIHGSDLVNDEGQYAFTSLFPRVKKLKFVGDCVQHALVCKGKLHAAIDTRMQPWDIAALVPCVDEAGGVATSLSGVREEIIFGGSLLTSCDKLLHNQIIGLLSTSANVITT